MVNPVFSSDCARIFHNAFEGQLPYILCLNFSNSIIHLNDFIFLICMLRRPYLITDFYSILHLSTVITFLCYNVHLMCSPAGPP